MDGEAGGVGLKTTNSLFMNLQKAASAWWERAGSRLQTAPLRPDESFFEYLVQHANSIILVSEIATSKIIFANRFALDFFGYSERELVGKPAVGTIIPAEESSGRNLEAMIAGLYRNPEMYLNNENENRRSNGEKVWVAWTNRALLNANGEFIGMLSIGNDITRRKLAEQERLASEEYYRAIFDNAIDAIIVTDMAGRPLDVNEAACRMYGYPKEDFLNIDPERLVAPESLMDREERLDAIQGERAHLETMSLRKNGEVFPVEYDSTHILYQGVPVVLNIVRDVTARRSAEAELARSESYYRKIFDNSGDPVFLINEKDEIVDANAAATATYGYTRDELLRMHGSELQEPEFLARRSEELQRLLHTGFMSYEGEHRTKTGCKLFVDVRASLVTLDGRRAWLSVVHDMTEQRERARQLSQFLSIAAHELSLPVTIIKGYTQTLGRHLGDLSAEALAQVLDSIEGSSNRLNSLVEELLDVTRIETGRLTLQQQDQELEPLLLDTVKEMQFKADEHAFEIRLAADTRTVCADGARIAQVLMILLDNASRFSPPDSLVEIEAMTSYEQAAVVISVWDRGIGVAEPDRERIFEPFSQVEDVEHHGNSGLGMGLYIAREIVKGHGGKIWCEDRPGGGSVFRFALPAG